jgi:hypothetical protein
MNIETLNREWRLFREFHVGERRTDWAGPWRRWCRHLRAEVA